MIETIHISNYALISSIDLELQPGLNILTGETGAGKSIILGALGLLLGNRADSKAVRDPSQKSIIEAIFRIDGLMPRLQDVFSREELDWDSAAITLRREIAPGGRSRAFVNDTPVSLSTLRDVAIQLVDIHSQHQNLLLAEPEFQLSIIDSLADNQQLLADYHRLYADYRKRLRAYQTAKTRLEESRADEEYIRFQLKQLTDAHLVAGEQEELEAQQQLLQNLSDVKQRLDAASYALSDGEPSAIDLLRRAADSVEFVPQSAGLDPLVAQRLRSALIEVRDIADTVAATNAQLQGDPSQLEAIDDRLNTIYSLQRKYHADSLDQLIAARDDFAARLANIDNGDQKLNQLKAEAREAKRAALDAAAILSDRRHATAESFAENLRRRAATLGMPNLQCSIAFTETPLTAVGTDSVEFRFSFNKNQEPMSVGKTASGGEISRLMLTIKAIAAEKMSMPAIIFDEVDTGVSGDIASRMGQMMADISSACQVISITHLPQVASKGLSHFKVYKEDDDRSTTTHIRRLSPQERIEELALMLSGDPRSAEAQATARMLLNQNPANATT